MSQNRFEQHSTTPGPLASAGEADSRSESLPSASNRPAVPPSAGPQISSGILLVVVGVAAAWNDARFGTDYSLRLLWLPLVVVAACRFSRVMAICYATFLCVSWLLFRAIEGDLLNPAGNPGLNANVWEAATRLVTLAAIVVITAYFRNQIEHYRRLQRIDPLTGLANLTGMLEQTEAELHRSNRKQQTLSLVFLDCDHFKTVNDTLGHQAGNDALQQISTLLQKNLRLYDLVARLGGDEFGILLPETDSATAAQIVDRLRAAIKNDSENRPWHVTMCWGVVTCDAPNSLSAQQLIDLADQQMYAAKREGTDRVCCHHLPSDDLTAEQNH